MDKRSAMAIKADALVRLVMWHTLSGKLPLFLVSEYPKSGGTWFSMMLAEYLDLPLPRNRCPGIRSSVMHGHHLYSPSFRNAFCVLRDGRDVAVSSYFHTLFENERNNPRLVRITREAVPFNDYDNVKENLPAFIEYMFTDQSRGRFRFTWSEFIHSWMGKNDVAVVRYEDLLKDCAGTLYRAFTKVLGGEIDIDRLKEISDAHSFEKVSKRKRGQENTRSFLRKGVAGDWKEKFSRKACEVFDHYAGEELVLAGYETDREWVKNAPNTAF